MEFVPLSRAQDGSIVTQFTMTTLEELGLLKMDFPGASYPDRYSECGKNDRKELQRMKMDMHKIDYNDKKVLDSLGRKD